MQLKDKIIANKPREKSGSTSSSRFDYQKDWGICKLIEFHQTESDYVIIFDWHDDLIIMDSEHDPKEISFYQIKGRKSGNWSLNDLTKSNNDKSGNPLLSIIGKLYDCKLKHEFETKSLNFVSNSRFKFNLKDKSSSLSKDEICIIELTTEDIDKITSKIKSEHRLDANPIYEEITFLKVLDLSLDDSKTHTQGKISSFFDALYPGKKLNSPTIYRMLFDEVKRRSNYNNEILSYSDLLSKKAISKSEFEKIIDATGIKKNYDDIWNRAESILLSDGLSYLYSQQLKKSWLKLEVEKMNAGNEYLNKTIGFISDQCAYKIKDMSMNNFNLLQCIEEVFSIYISENKMQNSYDEYFIKAIILSEIYE